MSSNTQLAEVAVAVSPLEACNNAGLQVFRVDVDTENGVLPSGFHVVAPSREQAENKLAVAYKRFGVTAECLPDIHLHEE